MPLSRPTSHRRVADPARILIPSSVCLTSPPGHRRAQPRRNRTAPLFAGLLAAGCGRGDLTAVIANPRAAADIFPGPEHRRRRSSPTKRLFRLCRRPDLSDLPDRTTPTWFASATWTPFLPADAVGGVLLPSGPTSTVSMTYPFRLADAVQYVANTNDQGCDWMSIAGQIWDMDGNPVLEVGIEVTGRAQPLPGQARRPALAPRLRCCSTRRPTSARGAFAS
jgi:hypothetical protein